MLEPFFSDPLLLIYSVFFGITMKTADLLDEHGLRLFKGATILFGVLWGTFGALMMFGNNILANFFLALIIHWILRYRIDYFNHGIAATIMLLTFLYILPSFTIDWMLFIITLVGYSLHGFLNDTADRKKITGVWAKYFQLNSHYFSIPIILIILDSSYWITLVTSGLFIIFYESTKYKGMKYIAKQREVESNFT